MNEQTDQQLLSDYAERRSEPAFAELVKRHIDLVHSAALRMTSEAHSAHDVTQAVFVALAQNAALLTHHPVLSAWLHTTARNLAAKDVRAAVRRQKHEQDAAAMNELLSTSPDASWEEIAPHLDVALGELSQPDRDAVLLRYFQKKSAAQMAAVLGISDEAAQKRLSRAVDKLRVFFSKRKITVGAGGLGILISANAVQSAPAGLSATISAAVLASTAVSTTSIVMATAKTIAMTTLQKTLVTATVAVLAGVGIYTARQAAQLRAQVQTLQQQQAPLEEQLQQLQQQRDKTASELAALEKQHAQLRRDGSEVLKLRGEVTQLRADASNPSLDYARSVATRVNNLRQRLEQMPERKIPELQFLTEQDWLDAVKNGNLDTEADYRRAFNELRDTAKREFGNILRPALENYLQSHDGQLPIDLSELKPLMQPPVDDSVLQRYSLVLTGKVDNLTPETLLVAEIAPPVDEDYDTFYRFRLSGQRILSLDPSTTTLLEATKGFARANNGQFPSDPSQLTPYLNRPVDVAMQQKFLKEFSPFVTLQLK